MFMDEITVAAEITHPRVAAKAASKPSRHEGRTFELPKSIWYSMFFCYFVFFSGLIFATGRSLDAAFMIVVSIGYTVMYFGTAAMLTGLAKAYGTQNPNESRGQKGNWTLDTITGPMSYGAVAAQILTVPAMFAFFGIAVAIIRSFVFS